MYINDNLTYTIDYEKMVNDLIKDDNETATPSPSFSDADNSEVTLTRPASNDVFSSSPPIEKYNSIVAQIKQLGCLAPQQAINSYIKYGVLKGIRNALEHNCFRSKAFISINVNNKRWTKEDLSGSFDYRIELRGTAQNGASGLHAYVHKVALDQAGGYYLHPPYLLKNMC